MSILVRRSNLLVSLADDDALEQAWSRNADAVTLDLEDGVVDERKAEARGKVRAAIALVDRGGGEVFVRTNKASLQADLQASVWPGLHGIVLTQVESMQDVSNAEKVVSALERQRGIAEGELQFIVLLESARAVWNMRAIITASPRITQAGLDEADLSVDLGIYPSPDHDPFEYARGRLAVETTTAKVRAVGMAYPLSVHPRVLPPQEIHEAANKARNLGMKGVICPHPSWIEPVNAAFTPTAEQVAYHERVRAAFAAGVATGTAAVALDGRMIDVPVDEWAIVVLATAEACAARDAEKKRVLDSIVR